MKKTHSQFASAAAKGRLEAFRLYHGGVNG